MSKPTKATPPPSSDPPDTSTYRPFEVHAAAAGTPAHLLAATRVHAAWLPGQEMSRQQYDDAVAAATRSVMK